MQLHIGIDDTDSRKGGCTTYIGARLVEKLAEMGVNFTDYPNIIRLNPNIPYKTRGNAAVALRVEHRKAAYDSIVETVLSEVEANSHFGQKGTEPAIVFVTGKPSTIIKRFSSRALYDVIPEEDATKIIRSSKMGAVAYGGTLGLVGALAAVGQTLEGDHTYEFVAYRERKNWGTQRRVDGESVKRMDKRTRPMTFNNYDYEHKRTLVTPHGPDPVLLGIRGEAAESVREAFQMLTVMEPIERWVIFRTNHGTDAHFKDAQRQGPIRTNRPITLTGVVADKPITIRGGHTFFTMKHANETIRCAAFEPTGELRDIAARFLPGDEITVLGGVHQHGDDSQLTINLEKVLVRSLAEDVQPENPVCPHCGKHMKSAGKQQGFRCARCSLAAPLAQKRMKTVPRSLKPGLYMPTPKAHRHLTKPLSRYGVEKNLKNRAPSGVWHKP